MASPIRNTLYLLILTVILGFNVQPAKAQRVVADVTVTTEHLPQENQNKLQGLERIIEAYINQTDWGISDEYDYDVIIDINFYFEEVIPVSFEDRYKAGVTVSNRSDCVYQDRRWEFPLQPGVQLIYTTQFDPFRSLIDYYVFMILGYEYDKLRKFGGNPYFEIARQIAQSATFSSRYFLGWDFRTEWLEEYIEPVNDQFRYLNFLYYTGEWLYYEERDRETARHYLLYAINQVERIPEERRERFFELNYYNYANALYDYEEYNALNRLASFDPDHSEFYQRLLDGR